MKHTIQPIRGRGSSDNPENRFEKIYLDYEPDEKTGEKPSPKRELIRDHTKEIISRNSSPDIPFDMSINPYRGCEHGCIYCYARPTHEFLGMSAGLDFESKIVVKYDAGELLRKKLSEKSWKPGPVIMSGVTDPYQPIERELKITRDCITVLAECRNPLVVITKNYLVTRDIDLLAELATYSAVRVILSVTSLDRDLCSRMEPRTSRPERRLQAIRELTQAGIPVSVNVAPIIPGLTDHECAAILQEAHRAGATHASYTLVRLPYGVKELFPEWLEQHYPDRKRKVLNKIMDMKNGSLNRSEFGERFRGEGHFAEQVQALFRQTVNRLGLNRKPAPLSVDHFVRPSGNQMHLFN